MFHKYQEQDIFSCSPYKIFHTVLDVEKYPDFVPWCKAVRIKEKSSTHMTVDLSAIFYGIRGYYTSEITYVPPDQFTQGSIKIVSSNGIFKHLYNEWQFIDIGHNRTVVKFYIEFQFKSRLFSVVLNSVYKYTQTRIVSAFKKRIEMLNNG